MDYIAECLEKFQGLSASLKVRLGGPEAYNKLKEIEKEFTISLSFYVILLVINELNLDNGPDYLVKKYAITKGQSQDITERINEEIIYPAIKAEVEANADFVDDALVDEIQKPDSVKYSAAEIEDIFDAKLIPTILQDKEVIRAFNISAFAVMDKDELLEGRLVNLFLNNEELISAANVIIDGRSYRGTIKNWLKDFISKHGSDIFDTFILAKYINSLDSQVTLNPGEKKMLTKVLKIYRNLVFFPDSMEKVPVESWSIIPYEVETVKQKVAELQEVISSKTELKNNSPDNYENDFKPSLSDVEKIRLELGNMLNDYSRDSLEYKAIMEEINRLNRKKL